MDWIKKAEQNLLPLSKNKTDLMDALNEWQYTGNITDFGFQTTSCDLCNHDGLRYHFEIFNSITHKKLSVGSTCLTRFDIGAIDNSDGSILLGKKRDNYLKTEIHRVKFEKSLEPLRILWELDNPHRNYIKQLVLPYKEKQKFSVGDILFLFRQLKKYEIDYDPKLYKLTLKTFEERMQYINLSSEDQLIIQEAMSKKEIESFYSKKL